MSQSRFSIVLVGVSALLRRPLVSRLRPADGERSSWVVFAARGCRFDSGFRSVVGSSAFRFGDCRSAGWFFRPAGWPSGSLLPLFGMHRFGDCRSASWPSGSLLPLFGTHRFGVALGGLVLPLGGLAFGFTASAFRHAPLRGCPRRVGSSAFRFGVAVRRVGSSAGRVGLRALRFRFSACTASEWPLGELVLPPSASEIALGGLAFGLTASAFRHAPLRRLPSASSFFRLPFRRLPLGGLAFGLIASAFRPAPLRGCPRRAGSSTFRFGDCRSAGWFFRWAGWPSGSPLPLFGMRRSAPLHRRSEDRRSTPTRQLFHFKTLIPTC